MEVEVEQLTKQDEDEVIVENKDEKSSPLWFLFRQKAEVKNFSNFFNIKRLHQI